EISVQRGQWLSERFYRPDFRSQRPLLRGRLQIQPSGQPPGGLPPGSAAAGHAGTSLRSAGVDLHSGARSAVAPATAGLRPAAALGRGVLLLPTRYAVCGGCWGYGRRGNGATERRYLLFAAGLAAAATLAQ